MHDDLAIRAMLAGVSYASGFMFLVICLGIVIYGVVVVRYGIKDWFRVPEVPQTIFRVEPME